jgi:hypothetical protein
MKALIMIAAVLSMVLGCAVGGGALAGFGTSPGKTTAGGSMVSPGKEKAGQSKYPKPGPKPGLDGTSKDPPRR